MIAALQREVENMTPEQKDAEILRLRRQIAENEETVNRRIEQLEEEIAALRRAVEQQGDMARVFLARSNEVAADYLRQRDALKKIISEVIDALEESVKT